jgi:hypothetical protein
MSPALAGDPVALTSWQPTVSGNATLDLSVVPAGRICALRLDFDFKGGKGFAVARRAWPRRMPEEYAVHLRLRGRGPVNDLEIKLIDPSGRNVWRFVAKGSSPPERWTRLSIESRDIEFAWGPASGSILAELGFIEIAIVAGEGGRGTLWIADLKIEDLTPGEAPTAVASSARPGFGAEGALGGAGWKPDAGDRRPWISVDSAKAAGGGGSCTSPRGREGRAATCISPASRRDSCASICRDPARVRSCTSNPSSSRARSTLSGMR